MMEPRIEFRLSQVLSRLRRFYGALGLAVCGVMLSILVLATASVTPRGVIRGVSLPVIWTGLAALSAFLTWRLIRWRLGGTVELARRIERAFPDLDARLLTAVDQRPSLQTGRFSYFQEQLIRQTLSHDFRRRWVSIIPRGRLLLAYGAVVFSWALFTGALLYVGRSPSLDRNSAGSAGWLIGSSEEATTIIAVEPGDALVEKGTSVLVVARFSGKVPANVELVMRDADDTAHDLSQEGDSTTERDESNSASTGQPQRLPMRKGLDDPLYGARVDNVQRPLRYYVSYPHGTSAEYTLRVFEFPRVIGIDARLKYPSYTQLPPKELKDVRRVTVPVGTELELTVRVNKPLRKLELRNGNGQGWVLEPDSHDGHIYRGRRQVHESQRWVVELVDEEGRPAKPPLTELVIQATPNRFPTLRWVAPTRDVRVSPLQELSLAGQVSDDYGVVRYGVVVMFGGGDPEEIVLGEHVPAGQQQLVEYLLNFEERGAEPDQLASFYLWAEDWAEDGTVRRAESDLYFAEVRPFEEIFREGQSPAEEQSSSSPSGEQGGENASAAEQLADLQKEIINATWKLKRSDLERSQPVQFRADSQLLAESQQKALEQLQQLGERLTDTGSLRHWADAQRHMDTARQYLEQASQTGQGEPLMDALPAERAAYEALLRLRAREHQVVRARRQSSSSGSRSASNSRMQEQLNELELRRDVNRYEMERQATSSDDPQQRQLRQTVSRLRELARRQQDLNEQIRQLESALPMASTPEERQQLEEQLKRLRDEQEEILRDTEQLQQRLDEQNLDGQLRSEQQQLEQTRENVRRASEALQQGRLSQALAEGSRAEQQFRQLQDDMRRRVASQYAEDMRQLRQEARQLDERQQQLGEQLRQIGEQQPQSLRDPAPREQLPRELQAQAERLRGLLQTMQQLIEQAEQDEPLLARRLYETYRETRSEQPEELLEQAAQWFSRGFPDQAQQPEETARQSIRQLTEGIELAAESVLGSELEALQRARRELDLALQELRSGNRQPAPGEPSSRNEQPTGSQPAKENEPPDGAPMPSRSGAQRASPDSQPLSRDRRLLAGNGHQRDSRTAEANAEQQPSSISAGDSPPPDERSRQQAQSADPAVHDNPARQFPAPHSSEQTGTNNDANQASPPTTTYSPRQGQQPERGRSGDVPGNTLRGGATDHSSEAEFDGGETGGPDWSPGWVSPVWGDRFPEWADRLRDAEEVLDDPRWRAELARIRDRARRMRIEVKRHSRPPQWDLVQQQIERPLRELRDRIAEEIRRRDKADRLAPVDRDPVPPAFDEQVRTYYERLGSGRR